MFGSIITVIAATLLLALNTYTKGTDLGEIAQKHADTASDLWRIRESYLSLLVDMKSGAIEIEATRATRDRIQEELGAIYKGSPRTISKAYSAATKALNVNEELTFSDKELDNLLPKTLRLTE